MTQAQDKIAATGLFAGAELDLRIRKLLLPERLIIKIEGSGPVKIGSAGAVEDICRQTKEEQGKAQIRTASKGQ